MAIVLAAGIGKRFAGETGKLFYEIKGKPVICYSLEAFDKCSFIDNIIVTYPFGQKEIYAEYFKNIKGISKNLLLVEGGAERGNSVLNALESGTEFNPEYVFIHDGARPLVTSEIIKRCYEEVKIKNAVIPGYPLEDTIKEVNRDNKIEFTPERSKYFCVQTPQTFKFDLIYNSYKKHCQKLDKFTDDGSLLEKDGIPVFIVKGSKRNLKITTIDDISLVEIYFEKEKVKRWK